MSETLDTAVVLAAGRGSRLRAADPAVTLDPAQAAAAEAGLKALVPFGGRPFLDFVVAGLERAGVRRICLVVGSAHHATFSAWRMERMVASAAAEVELAVQASPRGSGNALLAAEGCVGAGGELFLVVNSDNLYPPSGLAALAGGGRPALLAVDRRRLLADRASNADAAKTAAWSLVERDAGGFLRRIVEKPDNAFWAQAAEPVLLGVNAWCLRPSIFAHCRAVTPSPRGEIELPAAVMRAIAGGENFFVEASGGPLLDLSSRADVAAIAQRLPRWKGLL